MISPAAWARAEPLLEEALGMDAAARAGWLQATLAHDPELAALVRQLLQAHERAERCGAMETLPKLADRGEASAFGAGAIVGPFRLVRLLGRGGMGEVWLADQADGRVERRVALKLPAMPASSEVWRERFHRERDILARLSHAHIARLFDAGVAESGQPYLAMEYVEGASIANHVEARALPMPERLALFRQVLDAVAHAHRHLVVHRDLKPANILIDEAGQVKLLDFGIAKLLASGDTGAGVETRDLTLVGGRVMTLRYAAPEQAEGGAITTATDVYSLGVVLHELLTGASPYRAVREGKAFTEVRLAAEEIELPSRLSPRLAGDLDAILLKALRRAPADRYPSVEAFDQDVRAFLERRPVAARAGTWRYLAGRFVLRHRWAITTAALLLGSVVAGGAMVELQRREAVAQRERAQKHFASVRKLANTFMFDLHGEIETLPGSLKARAMLVRTSLEYLDALVAESAGDPALMLELATAYRKIGNVQGQVGGANTGDVGASIGNFEKAGRLLAEVERLKPSDIEVAREQALLSYTLARSYFLTVDPRWESEIAQAIARAERVAALPGATPRDRSRVAGTMAEQANLRSLMFGQTPQDEATVARAVAIVEALARELPGDAGLARNLASTYQRAASTLTGSNATPESARRAAAYRRSANEVFDALLAKEPQDERLHKARLANTGALASALLLAGDLREADQVIRGAVGRGAELLERDPANAEIVSDYSRVLAYATLIAHHVGDHPRAIRHGRDAWALVLRLPEETRATRDMRSDIAELKAYLGYALLGAAGDKTLDRDRRLALLGEARALLDAAAEFVAESRADKLGAVGEREVREIEAARAQCLAAIAKLRRG